MVIGKKKSKTALKFNIHTTTCPPVASHGVSSILYLKQADGQWKKRINKSPFMFYGKGVLSLGFCAQAFDGVSSFLETAVYYVGEICSKAFEYKRRDKLVW